MGDAIYIAAVVASSVVSFCLGGMYRRARAVKAEKDLAFFCLATTEVWAAAKDILSDAFYKKLVRRFEERMANRGKGLRR